MLSFGDEALKEIKVKGKSLMYLNPTNLLFL